MKAVIMAGGDGRRLRPLTCTKPKPLIPLLNRPILDYTMDLLAKHNINEAVFTLHYLGDMIKKHIGSGRAWGISASYSEPGRKLGTAGSVRAALGGISHGSTSDGESSCGQIAQKGAGESVLVLSGDGITDIDLSAVIRAHEQSDAAATIVLKRVAEPTEYGVALLDENGTIKGFLEKPERSEVFSDYANTGIYILNSDALELIPKDTDFDFSRDLFPEMLRRGMKIRGHVTDAYWCDIGDIAQYRQAQQDMLNGKCAFSTIAKDCGGVLIEPNANISGRAKLIPPCYIGSGARIADGVCIEPYSVVGSASSIEEGASVKRSVLFERSHIRFDSELRGAVVCEDAKIDERVSLFEGSAIGAGTHVGAGVTVLPNVCIWPHKQIENGSSCKDNIVWGSTARRVEFDGCIVHGYADEQMTPEAALRVGAAFASRFALPAKAAVCASGEPISVVLKYAVLAGIASQGVDAEAVNAASMSAFSYTVRKTGCAGGIYVNNNGRNAELVLFDENGIELSPDAMRSVRAGFLFGEQKPTLDAELGIIGNLNGLEEAYEQRLLCGIRRELMLNNKRTLRIGAPEQSGRVISRVLLRLGWNVERSCAENGLSPVFDENTIAVQIDNDGKISLSISGDIILGNSEVQTVIARSLAVNCGGGAFGLPEKEGGAELLVVPVSLPEPYRDEIKKQGVQLIYSKESLAEQRRLSFARNAYYPALYEPEAAVVKLCEMFVSGELKDYAEALPKVYTSEKSIRTAWKDIGRMLRMLAEGEKNGELVDGLRLKRDTGWVCVRPAGTADASFRIVAGSRDSEYAKELCDIYVEKLTRLRDSEKDKNS